MIWTSLDVDLAFNICRFFDLISCGHHWCWTRDPPCLRDTDLCQYTCHLGDTEATITVGIPLAEDGLDLLLVSKFPRNPNPSLVIPKVVTKIQFKCWHPKERVHKNRRNSMITFPCTHTSCWVWLYNFDLHRINLVGVRTFPTQWMFTNLVYQNTKMYHLVNLRWKHLRKKWNPMVFLKAPPNFWKFTRYSEGNVRNWRLSGQSRCHFCLFDRWLWFLWFRSGGQKFTRF